MKMKYKYKYLPLFAFSASVFFFSSSRSLSLSMLACSKSSFILSATKLLVKAYAFLLMDFRTRKKERINHFLSYEFFSDIIWPIGIWNLNSPMIIFQLEDWNIHNPRTYIVKICFQDKEGTRKLSIVKLLPHFWFFSLS